MAAAAIVAAAVVLPRVSFRQPTPAPTRGTSSTVTLVAPLGTQATLPSQFRWNPVAGAQVYRVRVFSEQGVPLWTSDDIQSTSIARPDSVSLAAGKYFWRVIVLADDEVIAESPLLSFVIRS